jgi:hypothetical protein
VLALLFVVPQTAAILAQTSLSVEWSLHPVEASLRLASVAGTLSFFLLLFAVVFPPDPRLEHLRPTGTVAGRLYAAVEALHERAQGSSLRFSGAFLRMLHRMPTSRRRLVGTVVALLGATVTWQLGPAGIVARHDATDMASVWPGLLLGGTGLWVALLPHTFGGDARAVTWGWRVPMRAIGMIACAWVFGQLLWLHADASGSFHDTAPYSLWGVGFLVFLAAVVGRCIDGAAVRSPLPVKVLAAFGAFVVLAIAGSDSLEPDPPPPLIAGGSGAGEDWYAQAQARLDGMSKSDPVLLVAASGGGSRAALFAALTYEALDATPLDEHGAGRTLGDQVLFISSVSGGSLASAYYQHRHAASTEAGAEPAHGASLAALATPLRDESRRLLDQLDAQIAHRRERPDSTRGPSLEYLESYRASFARVGNSLEGWPGSPALGAPWLGNSRFVNAMRADFMAAVLRAVIEPGLSRGESITRLWKSWFGLERLDNRPGSGVDGAPLVLFNATEVEAGRRYVIGLPRLPAGLLGRSVGAMDDAGGERWVTAAEAARLSANFPWGFDVVNLPGRSGAKEQGASDALGIDLLDGGIVDNTGLDSLAVLFEALAPEAGDLGDNTADTPRRTAARSLLATLRERGVILVEIDAGARPSEASSAPGLRELTQPLRALEAAGALAAEATRAENIDRIRAVVDAEGAGSRFYNTVFVCNRVDNVRTAWSLGTHDQAVTILQFLAESQQVIPQLRAARVTLAAHDDISEMQAEADHVASESRAVGVAVLSDFASPEAQEIAQAYVPPIPGPSRWRAREQQAAPPPAEGDNADTAEVDDERRPRDGKRRGKRGKRARDAEDVVEDATQQLTEQAEQRLPVLDQSAGKRKKKKAR